MAISDRVLALSNNRDDTHLVVRGLLSPVEPRPDGSHGVVSVDAPLFGEGANDVQPMMPGRINHPLIPGTAVVLDFYTGVKIGADRSPDSEGAAGQARAAVQGSVGCELGSAEDHVICSRAASEYCAQVDVSERPRN